MYDEKLTRQSLPTEQYRILLGTAITVFCSNNSFIIENLLRIDHTKSWYDLIDKESGLIKEEVKEKLPSDIVDLFGEIVYKRNRIIHGYQVTYEDGEQILATKVKSSGEQFYITEEYLLEFIKQNEKLSDLLNSFREKDRLSRS